MTRIAICVALGAASCFLVAHRAAPAAAQDKNKVATLEKHIQTLEQKLQQAQQQNNALSATNKDLQTKNTQLAADLKKAKSDDKSDSKSIKDLQTALDGYKGAGLIHVVLLKIKSDSDSAETQSLIDDANKDLVKIKGVRGVWAGKPAAKGTPDAASDYTVALVLVFDNADALKTYLSDSAHTKFVDKHLKKWETPVVYDFEPKKGAP
jgi:hypothetical protein